MTTESVAATDTPVSLAPADLSRIAQDLQIRRTQVEHAVQLMDAGNSIPFITRYRKEATGGLPEPVLRQIKERLSRLRGFAERQNTILKSIEAQGKLTDELKTAIQTASFPRQLEDLFLPFKPKKKTLAGEARDRGLEPLAIAILTNDPVAANLPEVLAGMVNPDKQINSADDALLGVKNIIIEMLAEKAELRGAVRRHLWTHANLTAGKHERLNEGKGLEYKDFFQYAESLQRVPPHRVMALNRGERENALTVRLQYDRDAIRKVAIEAMPSWSDHPHREVLESCLDESLNKVVLPALEREVRRELTEVAQHHAVEVFARNLRGLLMHPPVRDKRVLAIDPAFRPGCRMCTLDAKGELLDEATIYPHMPQLQRLEGKLTIEKFIRKYQPDVIAIGNGSACRETEELVAEVIQICERRRRGEPVPDEVEPSESTTSSTTNPAAVAIEDANPATPTETAVGTSTDSSEPAAAPTEKTSVENATIESTAPPPTPAVETSKPSRVPTLKAELEALPHAPTDLCYTIVNEAGTADYAASTIGREEFPEADTALRAAISIGRRLQNPLAELVKVDPQHLGVGLYHHDVHGKQFKGSLEAVIESCVNHIGVDVNTAAVPVLRHVAGLNQVVAREIVDHRQKHGSFKNLEELKALPAVGAEKLAQSAGFLRILDGDEPLDATVIHPDQYELARKLLEEFGCTPADLRDPDRLKEFREKVVPVRPSDLAQKLGVIEPLIWDLLDALTQPGRDPRDDYPAPIMRRDVLKIDDLRPGMKLKGTVLNVVDFGAFVDVGLKDSGLVHISQLANRYVRNPHELVSVGDVLDVWVLEVNNERKRVSLTMIEPGTPRTPVEPAPRSFGPRGHRPDHAAAASDQAPRQMRQDRPRRSKGRPPRPDENVELAASGEGPIQQRNTARFERKPPRPPKPLPTLTKEKKEGKAYLNTLGELEAFFKQRDGEDASP